MRACVCGFQRRHVAPSEACFFFCCFFLPPPMDNKLQSHKDVSRLGGSFQRAATTSSTLSSSSEPNLSSVESPLACPLHPPTPAASALPLWRWNRLPLECFESESGEKTRRLLNAEQQWNERWPVNSWPCQLDSKRFLFFILCVRVRCL